MAEERAALIAARKQAQLSQDELADMVGCSQQYISLIEAGARDPGPQLAKRIADKLSVPVGDIFPEILEVFRALVNNEALL